RDGDVVLLEPGRHPAGLRRRRQEREGVGRGQWPVPVDWTTVTRHAGGDDRRHGADHARVAGGVAFPGLALVRPRPRPPPPAPRRNLRPAAVVRLASRRTHAPAPYRRESRSRKGGSPWISPGGAAVVSQGREPLENVVGVIRLSPGGAAEWA